DERRAALGRGRDVEEADLVGALRVVGGGLLDRIAGVAQREEVGALHDPAVLHVEARDDPAGQHRDASTASATVNTRSYSARPITTAAMPASRSARRSSSDDTPPDAITSIGTARASAAVAGMLGPAPVPSR